MARSLQIVHEESPSTTPLLTGFLVIAALVLLAGAFGGAITDSAATETPAPLLHAR